MSGEKCPSCDGCGQVADTEDREPWTDWLKLPLGSGAAVVAGIVKPVTCTACLGTGNSPESEPIAGTITADEPCKPTPDAFKTWVHQWLDEHGVPKEFLDGPHSKEGCRIGDRMEWLLARVQVDHSKAGTPLPSDQPRRFAVTIRIDADTDELLLTVLRDIGFAFNRLGPTGQQKSAKTHEYKVEVTEKKP